MATTPDWPPIIQRPQAQRRLHRHLYQVVTLLAWLAWLYLFMPLAALLLWISGLHASWVQSGWAGPQVDAGAIGPIAVAAGVSALLLVVWGEIDRRRYTTRRPRHIRDHDELTSISEGLSIRLGDVRRLRDGRRTLVNFTPAGKILRVDGMDRPGPSRRGEMDQMLARVAETIAEARSLEDLTRPLLDMLEAASGFDSVYLTSIDLAAGQQRILFSRNVRPLYIPEGLSVPWEDTLCRRALEEGQPCTDNVPQRWPESGAARELGLQSYVSTPVHAGEALFGTLCAASTRSLTLSDEAKRLLGMFATLIGQQVERESMLASLQRANTQLSADALVDPLTGLANRRALLAELPRMLGRAQRDGSLTHVLCIDLDGFHDINERHGRQAGDALLMAMAARLALVLRIGDQLARYGGDEFVVIASATAQDNAEALRQRLAAATVGRFEIEGIVLDYPGASVGLATARPGDAADAVIAAADEAMYAVKRIRRLGAAQ